LARASRWPYLPCDARLARARDPQEERRMRRWMLLGTALLAACGTNDMPGTDAEPAPDTAAMTEETTAPDPGATAELRDTGGNVVGQARFTPADDGVRVELEVTSLPAGTHGV